MEQTFDEETLQNYLTELKNIQESLKQIQTDRQGLEAEEEIRPLAISGCSTTQTAVKK